MPPTGYYYFENKGLPNGPAKEIYTTGGRLVLSGVAVSQLQNMCRPLSGEKDTS